MSGAVKLVRNSIKGKFTYNGRGIAFDGEVSWSFDNDSTRNVIVFGVYNSSPSHTDNWKNKFLVLDEGPAQGIYYSNGAAEKELILPLVNQI